MKAVLTIILMLFLSVCSAQWAHVVIDQNNFNYRLNTDGRFFHDYTTGTGYLEVPAGSGIGAMFSASLWIGGIRPDNSVGFSGETFCQMTPCYFKPGPLKTNGSLEISEAVSAQFNRFWIVEQSEISQHIAYFDCLEDPTCDLQSNFPMGYAIPADFITWPAHGNINEGYANFLAPFFDHNGDGMYDAATGDYPLICGDHSTYTILNDQGAILSPLADPIGLEIHLMSYSFESTQPALFNSIFFKLKIINRSLHNYNDAYVGMWNDFDLGCPLDDRIGTDVQRSMAYVFNGDQVDENCEGLQGYGSDLAALGIKILAGPFKDSDGLDNQPISPDFSRYGNQTTGYGDGIIDNERLGLSNTIYKMSGGMGASPVSTDAITNIQRYLQLTGKWHDGIPQSVAGTGYNPQLAEAVSTQYAFFGNSDPLLVGTNDINPEFPDENGWTENSVGIPSGDRRMIASTGPFTFAPGDVQHLDYAYIFARDSHEPGVDVLETLRSYADAIVGMECGQLPQIVTSTRQNTAVNAEFVVYPNPSKDNITIEFIQPTTGLFDFLDISGRNVKSGVINGQRTEVLISDLKAGIYLIHLKAANQNMVKKLVIQ